MFWKAQVPTGMKILSWRLFSNALPVFQNLIKRGVDVSGECMLCGFRPESAKHLFMECWWARSLWSSLGNQMDSEDVTASPSDWLWSILRSGQKDLLRIIGVYLVWRNRDLIVHGSQGWTVEYFLFKAGSLRSQFESRRLPGFTGLEVEETNIGVNDSWKVFCDGSWSW